MLCENVYVRTNIFLVNSIHVCDEMNKIMNKLEVGNVSICEQVDSFECVN